MKMVKSQILGEIDSALQACRAELERLPADKALKNECSALESIHTKVLDHWPLTSEERARINIGLYAIRELEGINEDLAAQMATLEAHLTRES